MAKRDKDVISFLVLDLPRKTVLDIQRFATDEDMTVEEWINRALREQLKLSHAKSKSSKKSS